jgi:hypothetical protein
VSFELDFASPDLRLTVVPTVAGLSLVCAEGRIVEAGLELSLVAWQSVRAAARAAFGQLVEGSERIEELDYSPQRFQRIWSKMIERMKETLDEKSFRHVTGWIAEFQDFLVARGSSDLVTKLLQLRADPTYLAGALPVDTRRELVRMTAEKLAPLMLRDDVTPTDAFDRFIYSHWIDAGNPSISFDQYVAFLNAKRIVDSVLKRTPEGRRAQITRLLGDR